MNVKVLPLPHLALSSGEVGANCTILTDEALYRCCGVRIGFSGRAGGCSEPPYDSLNVGLLTDDDISCVQQNRATIASWFGLSADAILSPRQVHGDLIRVIDKDTDLDSFAALIDEGCDGLICRRCGLMPLLCFADCVSVIIVSPSGLFSVVHAGWRGVYAGIAAQSAERMQRLDAPFGLSAGDYNVYLGPHIGACCFEVSEELRNKFAARFGSSVIADNGYVDLSEALRVGLREVGVSSKRVADAGICTKCHSNDYYSYRDTQGICGRHAAFAFRSEE